MIQTAEKMEPRDDHQRGEEVHPFRDAVPAEDQHGQKARFEEEGENAFGRQGGAENVADVAGVGGPVGAELEFHDDAGGHAHGEVDGENAGPELRHGVIAVVAGAQVKTLHQHHQGGQADGKWRKQIVEHDRQRELHAQQGQDRIVHRGEAPCGLGGSGVGIVLWIRRAVAAPTGREPRRRERGNRRAAGSAGVKRAFRGRRCRTGYGNEGGPMRSGRKPTRCDPADLPRRPPRSSARGCRSSSC